MLDRFGGFGTEALITPLCSLDRGFGSGLGKCQLNSGFHCGSAKLPDAVLEAGEGMKGVLLLGKFMVSLRLDV